jgi:tetratricopeptide (TPR) repeat protein
LNKLGKYEESVLSYDLALAIRENFSSAWYNRGNVLANMGKLEEAIESYKRTLDYEPEDVATLFNLATAFEELNDFHQAIFYLERCVAIEPNYADAWYALACCYDTIDSPLFALNAINKACALAPDCADYLQAKAGIEFQLGYIDEALRLYREALALDPCNPYLLFDYGTALLDAQLPNQAVMVLEKLLTVDSNFTDAHYELALAYYALGDKENTIQMLAEAFKHDAKKKQAFPKAFPELYAEKSVCARLGVTKR